jgi:hypothetical protein
MIMNGEGVRMWKEMIMDYNKVSTEDNVINHEQFQLGQMMIWPRCEPGTFQIKCRALPLHQSVQ